MKVGWWMKRWADGAGGCALLLPPTRTFTPPLSLTPPRPSPPPIHQCGVHNLHGQPGILGGLVAGLASFGAANAIVAPHGTAQLAWQLAALAATVGIAAAGGGLVGWAVARANPYGQVIDGNALFDDGFLWTGIALEDTRHDNSVMGELRPRCCLSRA